VPEWVKNEVGRIQKSVSRIFSEEETMEEVEDFIKAIVRVDYEPSNYKRVNELLEVLFYAHTLSVKERVEISEMLVDYIRYDVPQQVRDACA